MRINEIILVDDDDGILNVFSKILKNQGYHVYTASNGEQGLNLLKKVDADLVITDMYMPIMGGMDFIEQIKLENPLLHIMIITGEGSIDNAVRAIKKGAISYLEKPLNIKEFIHETKKIIDIINNSKQNESLKEVLRSHHDQFIGESRLIQQLKEKINIISDTESNILITGESGTGKELVAQAIHNSSSRADYPMIKVNCAALSVNLLESELFGHEKGAFTGAYTQKKGRFELANGGTLFLDEIGEMPFEMQAKLLRIIQEKTYERVGGSKTLHANFRLICATNRNLESEIIDNNFREDLFYRLNVIPLHIPPLRERKEDILPLVKYYTEKFAKEMNRVEIEFTRNMYSKLNSYTWPGNIRELKNVIERATVFSDKGKIMIEEFPIKISSNDLMTLQVDESLSEAKEAFEKKYIRMSLDAHDWKITQTAEALRLARKNLYAKIKKYDLKQ